MQITNNQINIHKMDEAYDILCNNGNRFEKNRFAMSSKTIKALEVECCGSFEHPPLAQVRARYSSNSWNPSYRGIPILEDNSLDFGEVSVLIHML